MKEKINLTLLIAQMVAIYQNEGNQSMLSSHCQASALKCTAINLDCFSHSLCSASDFTSLTQRGRDFQHSYPSQHLDNSVAACRLVKCHPNNLSFFLQCLGRQAWKNFQTFKLSACNNFYAAISKKYNYCAHEYNICSHYAPILMVINFCV